MKTVLKSFLLSSLLATAGLSAYAQSPMSMGDHGPMMHEGGMMHRGGHGRMDPAKMEAMVSKHLAELKTQLKITAAQEGAWTTFTSVMKPPAMAMAKRPDHSEMDKLSTPDRIDKMSALRKQHMAEMQVTMDKRDEAVKALYTTLSAEQKKTFDAAHAKMRARFEKRRG
jgi:hypothetical protein